jgi:hypothetical protein
MCAANDQARISKRAVIRGETVAISRSDTVHFGSAGQQIVVTIIDYFFY